MFTKVSTPNFFIMANNEYIGFKQSPWQCVGTQIGSRITAEEAISLGKLDYIVKKAPNIHRFPTGEEIISNDSFFTYREDTCQVLGAKLGKDYQVVNNWESLSVVNDILESEPGITIENSGILNNGATSFIALKRQMPLEIVKGDDFQQFILLSNSFDGSKSISVIYTNTRLLCANQCAAIVGRTKNQYKHLIRHTSSATERIKEAMRILSIGETAANETKSLYQDMMKTKLTSDKQFRDYVFNLLLDNEEIALVRSGKVSLSDLLQKKPRIKNIAEKIERFYHEGDGQSAIRGTMFGAKSAITGYFSNMRAYKNPETRMDSMIWGNANRKTIDAHYLAMNPQLIKSLN